jgi:hypothetical protein
VSSDLRRVSRYCASSTASSSNEPRKPLNNELVAFAIVGMRHEVGHRRAAQSGYLDSHKNVEVEMGIESGIVKSWQGQICKKSVILRIFLAPKSSSFR